MPELYIITGSNGAGKSSIGPEYLPVHIRQQGPIFDGDKLLKGTLLMKLPGIFLANFEQPDILFI
jgi:hypothetical protein